MTYDTASATAQRLISDKGRNLTLRSVVQGTYDPATDTIAGDGETDQTIKGVVLNFSLREILGSGELIKRGDKKILTTVAPAHNDLIIDGSEQYRVIDVEQIKPGDTAILYKVQARK